MILYKSNNLQVDIQQFSCPKRWDHTARSLLFSFLLLARSIHYYVYLFPVSPLTSCWWRLMLQPTILFSSVFLVSAGGELPVATLIRANGLKACGEWSMVCLRTVLGTCHFHANSNEMVTLHSQSWIRVPTVMPGVHLYGSKCLWQSRWMWFVTRKIPL